MDWLVKTIEAEIIPRLLAAHHDEAQSANPGGQSQNVEPADIEAFLQLALHEESMVCQQHILDLVARGVPLQKIYLDLLTPAARRLDAMWTADECDFTQVTIALWRMQQVMYDLSPVFRNEDEEIRHRRKIMLMPVPGSQHTLGILMVAEFFRRAGWNVWGEPTASRDRLLEAVHEEWFDIAGISIGSEPQLIGLADFISELRRASKNHGLIVMIGGPLVVKNPELVAHIGADAFATDAEHAIGEAESIVATQQQYSQMMTKGPSRAN